jgi:hypothetical protein
VLPAQGVLRRGRFLVPGQCLMCLQQARHAA